LGKIPEDRREPHITPVFKRVKKEDPGNYRLVSLTLVPGKVMEQLILEPLPGTWWTRSCLEVISMDSQSHA